MKLIVNNLAFAYNEQSPLWQNVSFTLNKGEVMTILGSNGIGKTTLLRTLIGFFKPLAGGSVRLLRMRVMNIRLMKIRKSLLHRLAMCPRYKIQLTRFWCGIMLLWEERRILVFLPSLNKRITS